MKRSNRTALLVLGAAAAALWAAPRGVTAQPAPARQATPAAAAPESAPVTLQLRGTPLRMALETLFQGTGLQHAVEPAVPDYPVTLSIHDVPFSTALRTLLRLVPGVAYRKEGEVYIVGMRPPAPTPAAIDAEPSEPIETATAEGGERVERIPINYLHPAVLAYILNGRLVPTEDQLYSGAGGAGGYGSGLNGYGAGSAYGNFSGNGPGANGQGIYANGALSNGTPGYGNSPGAYNGFGQNLGNNTLVNPLGNSAILAPRARRF
jgi:hypothetical protein